MVIINRSIRFHSESDGARLAQRRASIPEASDLATQWKQLLGQQPPEAVVQTFLEQHPVLVPGLWDLHNGPLHDVVVTKLPLGPDYKTDFAFITRHSMALQFTFVELEAPSKRIFNKNGEFSQEFNHARQQVADWVQWSERNIGVLVEMFGSMFETYPVTEDQKVVRGYLVYGRREEVEADRRHKERWQSVQVSSNHRIIVMTYDRLDIDPDENRDLIVCTYENRQFYAKPSVI